LRVHAIVFVFLASIWLMPPSYGQSPNGTISGLVLDPSGAVIAGAEITIVNDATRLQYSTKTNNEGIYVVPNLPPGSYRLQVSKIGFKTLIKPDITLNVQDALAINFTVPVGAASETVTVKGGAPLVNTESGAVSTVIDRQFVENLPLNGRSFNTLLQLTPGVMIVPASVTAPGQFSVNGQRSNANYFTVDGVSADFGSTISVSPGPSGGGATPAFSALGGTGSLVSVDAVEEFRVETSSFAPEFGRAPGGQVVITTRSGTNQYHGTLFEYFRNDVLDANDWFANSAQNPRPKERQNDFGGVFGGPVISNKTFFFLSYEGLRLRQPETQVIDVPSLQTRAMAIPSAAIYIDAYPLPSSSSASSTNSTVPFTGSYSNSAAMDAGSIRIDHTVNDKLRFFGRYNESPSSTASRQDSLSEILNAITNTRTITAGADVILTARLENNFRANYSTQKAGNTYSLDSFGGAIPPPSMDLVPSPFSVKVAQGIFLPSDAPLFISGRNSNNRVRQIALDDTVNYSVGKHQLKFGIDYRSILTSAAPANFAAAYLLFGSLQQFAASGTADLVEGVLDRPGEALFRNLSLYAQDAWKVGARLTFTYGLRWEIDPAPVGRDDTFLASWQNVSDPAETVLAPAGTSVWHTTYRNFAPRLGLALKLDSKGDFVLRGGWGSFYDLGTGQVAGLLTDFPNSAAKLAFGLPLPLADASAITPTFSLRPPYQVSSFINGFSPNLQLPRSYQWNVALEKSLGSQQTISLTYVGQLGRQLLRVEDESVPNANFGGPFFLTTNSGTSNYNALQVQFRRPVTSGLQALANYTWSHSIDNDSNDFFSVVSRQVISAQNDRASSDFDVRHNIVGALTYNLPNLKNHGAIGALARSWALSGVVQARTGFPINVVSSSIQIPGVTAQTSLRPDLVPGVPVWLRGSQYPGGRALNPAAFDSATPAADGRQGDLGRNAISGFGMTQVDISLTRRFNLTERWNIEFRTDAFNVLNHPNFANPGSNLSFSTFGLSTQMLNHGLSGLGGGLNPLYQVGGPRSLQLSLKLQF
jgi:Carboxypeptidase regulatory-like domain/TonB-dependent Receptor Plug Domain